MTTMPLPAAQPVTITHAYTGPDGRWWDLDHEMLDFHARGWQWDGQPYTAADGPVLHEVDDPGRHERLLALAVCSALWQIPLGADQDLAHLMDSQDELLRGCAGRGATS